MAEAGAAPVDVPRNIGIDTNYRKARDLLRRISQEMYEMKDIGAENSDRLERLQQKANDITDIIDLVEREFESVEEDDWRPTLPVTAVSLGRKGGRQDDMQESNERRDPRSTKKGDMRGIGELPSPKDARQDDPRGSNETRDPTGQNMKSRTDEDDWQSKATVPSTPLERKDFRQEVQKKPGVTATREKADHTWSAEDADRQQSNDVREGDETHEPFAQDSRIREAALGTAALGAAAIPASLERRDTRQDDLRSNNGKRGSIGLRSNETGAALETAALSGKTAAYRPAESYRPSAEPLNKSPQAFPRASSPPGAVQAAQQPSFRPVEQQNFRSGEQQNFRPGEQQNFKPGQQQNFRPGEQPNFRPGEQPSFRPGEQPNFRPGEQPNFRPGEQPNFRPGEQPNFRPGEQQNFRPDEQPNFRPGEQPNFRSGEQQSLRTGARPNEERAMVPSSQADRSAMPPISNSVEDDNYEVPSNMSFNHGPNFSNCIASMELSDIVYDLADAQEDLTKAKEKLRKARERDDAEKVDRYAKRVAETETEIREIQAAHWKIEVEPLRRAYRFEILRCLQQLEAAIKYTESLQSEIDPDLKTQQGQGALNVLEADALHDMDLLQKWLELCLSRPQTWRKEDRLLVGLVKGHPGSSLKDPQFVGDLLQEASQVAPISQQMPKSNDKDANSAVDRSDSGRTPKITMVTPDLLEGLLNGAMPKEVAENIESCPVCKGEGGDLDHAKLCPECDGAGSSKDGENELIEMCPRCLGRGFRLSKKHRCPACDGFKIVLRIPEEKTTSTGDQIPAARDLDAAPKRSTSAKRASFQPEPEVLSDSGRSKKHRDRDYSTDEATRSPPRSASTGPSRRRRQSESRGPPDAAASLSAVLGEVFKASQLPKGEKGKGVLSAALAALSGASADGGRGTEVSDSARSGDEEEDYDEKPRRKRRGSTRH